ncbi:glycine/D-amino acid oxidase-like deaminating enzyme/nitrite reductase/ring-hydroxylating ferredoxin subunit [Catenulispora sp. MAP12-49]|uniref:FAD-dependent oxidoreductase n=1 Tax=Catenulispora sp. MAP12-49 TaxID=3156302 RepID=UPI003512540C
MTDEAYWTMSGGTTGYPNLDGRGRADVAVIGGGAAGLWTAWELARTGRRVALLEAGRVAEAAKGGGAGRGSVLQALAHSRITDVAGAEAARSYAEAQTQAVERIAQAAELLGVDCGLERRTAYLYAADEHSLPTLHEELAAAHGAGVPAVYGTGVGTGARPLFAAAGALYVDEQIQFHPYQLLTAIAQDLLRLGSAVYEHSRVVTVDVGDPCVVMTDSGASVAAEHVVVATGYPITASDAVRRALRPRRELLLAGAVPAERAPQGMYAAVGESGMSVRSAPLDGERRLVMVSGERYEAGSGGVRERFARLAAWAAANVGLGEAEYRWSAQDYETDDHLPLIGRASATPGRQCLWIATGSAGWDATAAVLAGRLITAGIRGTRPAPWTAAFAPERLDRRPRPEGAWSGPARSVVRHRIEPDERDALDAIRPGDGAVVDVGGEHCAAFRDDSGLLHMVSALCPHSGCTVGFNDAEKTWECPCHGSRFATDGALLQGPAAEPLAPARAYLAMAAAE